ncbi:teichoic acid D-Ala incorporation-associated protein DltX [Lacticaseibacillus yichunensis]|uniref:Teichoic acid D-Ala incorporation-associated protein DltX n=1 Tax=Lacticaseibacillus yichunensis TaxID=2486015 RepID=A0ABW4CQ67_9LACO|nr:teichoic acid D-Ala incorporation-associated protein DltX [Lacticaseibacillus yichunensis]
MTARFLTWWHKPVVQFIGRTLLYAIIIMILVYLYSYRGVTNSRFIYNEF